MHSRRLQKLIWIGTAVLLLIAGAGLQRNLNRQRSDLGLTRLEPLENAPPVLAFTTVALGSFRGLIANALWVRANDLQTEGKYFEQVQLADWITKLEPHFVQVWLVQAWNMAYNISVKFRDPNDRWRWVQNGIELLRDQGLKYNPQEPLIYRELAWFFQHKIGQNIDDAHLLYKYSWANQMTALFAGPRPNFDELLNPVTEDALRRVRVLRERYKMEPALMKKAEEQFGPLEWRLPEAHAIYWAMVGIERSPNQDHLPLRRNIYQSLQASVLRGRIVLAQTNHYRFAPDLSKIPLANEGFEKMIAQEKDKPDAIRRAHRNFLKEIVYVLYNYNRPGEANRWLNILRQAYPDAVPAGESVDAYALKRTTERVADGDHNRTKAFIEGRLTQYFENLVVDEDDRATILLRDARQIWDFYADFSKSRPQALAMEPFPEMYRRVLESLLNPTTGLPPEYAARLRTKLNLPPPTVAPTPPSPAAPSPTNPADSPTRPPR
jgi:hypothetical protein